MRTPSLSGLLSGALVLVLVLPPQTNFAGSSGNTFGIPPKVAADYIHAVIEADRTIYAEYIVERLSHTISLKATENWEKENTLPLPAQFLLLSSQLSQEKNIGMSYRLASLWPINKANNAKSNFEKTAMAEVVKNPSEPHTGIIALNGKRFYKAVYADKAVTKACITCHNTHPGSPKTDFKLGDVMGAVIINLSLGDTNPDSGKTDDLLPPEVVADYIHSVLEADRTVYSEQIVNRLQNKKITYATEHWWEENALLLPAQFLLNASELITSRKTPGIDFKLASLWPINSHNSAANEFERMGLEYVSRHPVRPFISSSKMGGKYYFQAIYPDFAVTPACINCHNTHPNSPKRDFKLNDVMGGIVVTFPIN